MRGLLAGLSIRNKLVAMSMAVSALALVIAFGAIAIWDYVQFRSDIQRDLAVQAGIVLENSTAAISFDDEMAAQENMRTLAPNTHLRLACLYDASNDFFVEFKPGAGVQACPAAAPGVGYRYEANRVHVTEAVNVAGRPAGFIYLQSDLDELQDHLRVQAGVFGGVLLVVLLIAYVASAVLQYVVSGPIGELADTARAVTSRGDYSLRARKTTRDELGILVDAFNGMLGQIQQAEGERAELLRREREANRLKDEFLMTLSHELRTPLNAILGWTRMLITRAVPQANMDSALQKIERNAQAQARLVEDLLEVSRFTTGKFHLVEEPIDLIAVVNTAIEAVTPHATGKDIRIEKRFTVPRMPMVGDADRLEQVVWNLLSNAVKFSSAGQRIVVTASVRAGQYEVAVSDTGVGIDAAFLPHVFDPFRQADASSTRQHGGLGLGLSIARRIAELHGGEVTAHSDGLGSGATFTLRLSTEPRGRSDADRHAAPPAGEVRPDVSGLPSIGARSRPGIAVTLPGTTVLVVDDDEDTREILRSLLSGAGASVHVAASADEAIRLAVAVPPDVVICDIAMPGQDGYALLDSLKRLGLRRPFVAVALTAQAAAEHEQRALAAGFQQHVA